MAFTIELTVRGVLLAGKWETENALNQMTTGDKRNTLIYVLEHSSADSTSFSHEHGYQFQEGVSTTCDAVIPLLGETKTTISLSSTQSQSWNITKTNTTTQSYTNESDVSVPPGKCIKYVASVTSGEMNVPYSARIRTEEGIEKTISGTWNGVSTVNLLVKQEEVSGD